MTVSHLSQLLNQPFSHVINGKSYPLEGAKLLDVIDPATEKSLAKVPIATKEVLDQAVDAAHVAFQSWGKTSWAERARCVQAWREDYNKLLPELAKLLTNEQGKSAQLAQMECSLVLKWFDHMPQLELAEKEIHQTETHRIVQRYYPLGVAGGIVPWNFPVLLMMNKVISAVVTGNCIIIKPSPFTPLCDIRIIESAQAHFPPGVIQIVSGDDSLGPWVTEHPRIQKISFTGSTATGRLVARSCAATLKRYTLELGGNDPCIVLPEQSDLASVAQSVLISATMNSGQVCIASKRIYVHDSIYDQFAQALVEVSKHMKVGPGHEDGITHGPINNKMQFDKVGEFFADSQRNGHKFLTGGVVDKQQGYFYPITLVNNPPESSKLVREEPFGPIVPLLRWSDEADLVKRANDTEWGLGAIVWGSDLAKAERIARQLESGTVWINSLQVNTPEVPFGGAKSSGIGAEFGREGLVSYTQLQAIFVSDEKTSFATTKRNRTELTALFIWQIPKA